jgi:hypothetical protein
MLWKDTGQGTTRGRHSDAAVAADDIFIFLGIRPLHPFYSNFLELERPVVE